VDEAEAGSPGAEAGSPGAEVGSPGVEESPGVPGLREAGASRLLLVSGVHQ
jgi:hypothetical protein